VTRAPLGALAVLGGCGALVAALLVARPADASGESFGVTSERVGVASFDVGFCLTAGTALPATVSSSFTVARGGTTVVSGAWWTSTPTQVLIGTDPCPAPMAVVTVTGLEPSTAYTVTAQIVLAPMVEAEDGTFSADGSRSTVTLDASTSITTSAQPADVPDGEDRPSASASPSPSASPSRPHTSPTAPAVDPSSPGAGPAPVVIARPEAFPPARLAALTPAQVATIRPSTFGQLPAETVRALRPSQAAALTPGQVSAVRPGRAAVLTPRVVAAVAPASLARLRPASVAALRPAAVAAMTDAQLRVLTRAQVRALTPEQLAALTPRQRGLLAR
jgi:hypothetical protein